MDEDNIIEIDDVILPTTKPPSDPPPPPIPPPLPAPRPDGDITAPIRPQTRDIFRRGER